MDNETNKHHEEMRNTPSTDEFGAPFGSNEDVIWIAQKVDAIRAQIGQVIIGQKEAVDLMMLGVFSAGHVLLEGVPGVAKTLAAKTLAKVLDIDFSRIQFTPDLMPSDIIGTSIFNRNASKFEFQKGPIFSNIVLIDEINRSPAKTQAALFEVMEERQISYDGTCYPMEFPFFVVATQNPVEQEGTYSLPEAQLDRFLFKIKIGHPSKSEEIAILQRFQGDIQTPDLSNISKILTPSDIARIHKIISGITIEEKIIHYIAEIVDATRNHGQIFLGASPRASLAIMRSAKANAAIMGRDFVTPDDVQFVVAPVLNHRLILTPEAEMENTQTEDIVLEILRTIEVPR